MHHRGLIEGVFSDCESSLSHADTEVCESPQAVEVGLGCGDLCGQSSSERVLRPSTHRQLRVQNELQQLRRQCRG